ncbi:hypothetical protein RclHR1_01670015 [Rhizophagus clarus]|uniref:Sentrin-specific protease 1-like n=1 Tax=Rhizophagus clarus TaxID=94130 RepID=A0A2Z6QX69_9GLOM|nr:hypothetical protein RclHR1_01670015 [Rhizophagus clarus]GES96068.1 sentrin-specific protease 1-like [Rhizophagus clarus]
MSISTRTRSKLRTSSKPQKKLEEEFPEVSEIFNVKEESQEEFLKWLNKNKNRKKSIYIRSESLTIKGLIKLQEKDSWLSSDQINMYLTHLNTKFEHIHSFTSYFYMRLAMGGYSSVANWTKKTEIYKKETIFVPINITDDHWILVAIFIEEPRRIVIIDSFGSVTDECATEIEENLITWLNKEYHKVSNENNEVGNPINATLDLMFDKEEAPQVDGYSCGVFICMFARLIAENIEMDKIKNIVKFEAVEKFRQVMCIELWNYAE